MEKREKEILAMELEDVKKESRYLFGLSGLSGEIAEMMGSYAFLINVIQDEWHDYEQNNTYEQAQISLDEIHNNANLRSYTECVFVLAHLIKFEARVNELCEHLSKVLEEEKQ